MSGRTVAHQRGMRMPPTARPPEPGAAAAPHPVGAPALRRSSCPTSRTATAGGRMASRGLAVTSGIQINRHIAVISWRENDIPAGYDLALGSSVYGRTLSPSGGKAMPHIAPLQVVSAT